MEERKLYHNATLIAPKARWPHLEEYKAEYPTYDFPILTQEMVEGLFRFSHGREAVSYLLSAGYSAEEAKSILESLHRVNEKNAAASPKLASLFRLKGELLSRGYVKGDLDNALSYFRGRTIVYHGYPYPIRTQKALEGHGFVASFPEPDPVFPLPVCRIFDDGEEELAAQLAAIAGEGEKNCVLFTPNPSAVAVEGFYADGAAIYPQIRDIRNPFIGENESGFVMDFPDSLENLLPVDRFFDQAEKKALGLMGEDDLRLEMRLGLKALLSSGRIKTMSATKCGELTSALGVDCLR
ncbi:MAG: hypothetical protein Q4F15_02745 [Bacillota bacterium]|nr:hypothetical protein [Bacillota bacterium]